MNVGEMNLPGLAYHFAWMGEPFTACGLLATRSGTFGRRWTNNPSEMSHVSCFHCIDAIRARERSNVRSNHVLDAESATPGFLAGKFRACFARGFVAARLGEPETHPYGKGSRSRIARECWNMGYRDGKRLADPKPRSES